MEYLNVVSLWLELIVVVQTSKEGNEIGERVAEWMIVFVSFAAVEGSGND